MNITQSRSILRSGEFDPRGHVFRNALKERIAYNRAKRARQRERSWGKGRKK